MYIGATVLLPAGYDLHPDQYYPVIYEQGHFTLNPPLAMQMQPDPSGSPAQQVPYRNFQAWSGPHFPRMIAVTFQHPTPYYDDSYAVNSANNGPYGDALMEELIPYIETHFRIIRQPWARVLTGGSTGGWESLALQLYHPAFFGGTFTGYPDPIDFRHYQLVNIYRDSNAFEPRDSPVDRERPFTRNDEGQVQATERQESQLEDALGSHGRSGQQLDAWVSVFGPTGPDGYPLPLWNLQSGRIDPSVAAYMRNHDYDLRVYLAKNWPRIGPQLTRKLFVWVGDMDSYYLNLAVYDMDAFFCKHPEAQAHFIYGRPEKGHGWTPWTEAELIRLMARHVAESAPAGTNVRGWYEP
jgi:Putative esterase